MWKKLNDKRGSILLESMTGMTVVCVVIITIIPLISFMFSQLTTKKHEIEVWRFFQDVAIESIETLDVSINQSRRSDDVYLELSAKNHYKTVSVRSNTLKGMEEYHVQLLEVE